MEEQVVYHSGYSGFPVTPKRATRTTEIGRRPSDPEPAGGYAFWGFVPASRASRLSGDYMKQSESANQYLGVYAVIVLLALAATIYRPDYFQTDTVYMMLRQAAALGILSMGHLFVITAGGTDLSVGATMRISMVVFMLFYATFGGQWLAAGIAAALVVGVGLGAVNGIIITKFNVEPFLVTIFTGSIFDGLRRMFTGVSPMGTIPPQIATFVKGEKLGQVPYAAYILLSVTAVTYVIMNKTAAGRKLILAGSSSAAADFSGIRVRRVRFFTYMVSGGVAVLAAIVVAGYTGYVDQETLAAGMGFDSLKAVGGFGRATIPWGGRQNPPVIRAHFRGNRLVTNGLS